MGLSRKRTVMMTLWFFFPPILVVYFTVFYAIIGTAIGAVAGWLTSLITRSGSLGVVKDAFLGTFGFLAGFVGCLLLPWPENTVVEYLGGAVGSKQQ
jgi:uncharacterized membrane protein YeaQ/YmgE (transglycosylase-associated protein family)